MFIGRKNKTKLNKFLIPSLTAKPDLDGKLHIKKPTRNPQKIKKYVCKIKCMYVPNQYYWSHS